MESISSGLRRAMVRAAFNCYPPYRGSGARVADISPDFRSFTVRIDLNWRTRNLVGTVFGGSIYTATDPIFMTILIIGLGPEYVVWDKAATVQFKRPGNSSLTAVLSIADSEIESIKKELETVRSTDREYTAELSDKAGNVCATVKKTLYIAHRKEGKNQKVRPIYGWLMKG